MESREQKQHKHALKINYGKAAKLWENEEKVNKKENPLNS
jgi:hypothetical protein